MINSRNVNDLDLPAREMCLTHIAKCQLNHIEIIVTSTWRDIEAQDGLYAIGRTREVKRRPVTNARGGHSWHNYKCAWDVVPLIGGKAVWDATDPVWREVVDIGRFVGAEAGADWKTFPDLPHFQFVPRALTIDQAFVLFRDKQTIFV